MTGNIHAHNEPRPRFIHEALVRQAQTRPNDTAICFKSGRLSYAEVLMRVQRYAERLMEMGVRRGARIAVLLPNCPESVVSGFAAFMAGCVYVPINPLLRTRQLQHLLADCDADVLVTTDYLAEPVLNDSSIASTIGTVVLTDIHQPDKMIGDDSVRVRTLTELSESGTSAAKPLPGPVDPTDTAVLFYTSGSTGPAKGVQISHENVVDGARIVSGYLGNSASDRIVAALPLSFDYGFSQVTTAFYVGAQVLLTNYSMAQSLLAEVNKFEATALAGVPTMWSQLARTRWPADAGRTLRYVTNSGGRVTETALDSLRRNVPHADVYLMYGLTEAFRSTFLPPDQLDHRPDSIGKAIPEVTIHVINERGEACAPNEPGELVHSGKLVSKGYLNADDATARKFRPLPDQLAPPGASLNAVWSGDVVRQDEEGYLYFVERQDNLIKSSGYRISPFEIEDVIQRSGLVDSVVAIGISDPELGQRIGIALVPNLACDDCDFAVRHVCARELPPYMQPGQILVLDALPLTPNHKPDRTAIATMFDTAPASQD